MSILDEIEDEERVDQKCKACSWLRTLEPEAASDFTDAMQSRGRKTSAIFRVAVKYGFEGSVSTLEKHRKESHTI